MTTLGNISMWLGLERPRHPGHVISHILTDSRSLIDPDSTLFFAITTATDDGHKYIPHLYAAGVRSFVVTKIEESYSAMGDADFLIVENTVKALQKLAQEKRHEFRGEVVGITGSRGKTTLKEWLYQLLQPIRSIQRSPRSYNSQIGVPLSIWAMDSSGDIALIEAGISKEGEMNCLAECINPDTVILTNIGDAHSEGFASDHDKSIQKSLLASQPSTKLLIYCADYPLWSDAISLLPPNPDRKIFSWSATGKHADVQIKFIPADAITSQSRLEYKYANIHDTVAVPGNTRHDFENASNALAFMLSHGFDKSTVRERFKALHKIGTRLNVVEGLGGCSIVYDSYTSDFSSLPPALDFLRRRATNEQSLTLIISDLNHESRSSHDVYSDVASNVASAGISRLIGIGPKISECKSFFKKDAEFYPDTVSFLNTISPSDFANEIILIKGAPKFGFHKIAELLEARTHETVLEVNLDAIVRNYNYFRSKLPKGTGIVCMVKADGYGAGSLEVAKTLQDCGAAYIAVAVLDEGIELRKNGISMPIMVMNPRVVNYQLMFKYRLEPEIYSFDMLGDVIREARKHGITGYPVHIKLDTGMHRMGFIKSEIPELMAVLNKNPEVYPESVFSHLATADMPSMDDYTLQQLSEFEDSTHCIMSDYPGKIKRHILNSAGILRFPAYHYDMVRLGIGLYGANTLPETMERKLWNVSTLRTVIIAIRQYQPGQTIGYGRHGRITRPSKIATIPIGYADGMNRHFGQGTISVLVNGQQAPTIGNICMDACMIDVTDIDCRIGDAVEIFGNNAGLQRLADVLETIPYEILTSISPRVKRVYYRE